MRFLIRVDAPEVPRESLLGTVKGIAKTLGVDSRNPKWTSYGALELDIFSPSRADFDLFISAVRPLVSLEFVRDLNVAPPHRAEDELFAEARSLFNAERYWESHEVLEGVWRTKQGKEKRLIQGIILVCAAFVHHQKGEDAVAVGVLRRATPLLEVGGMEYGGFAIDKMVREVQEIARSKRFAVFYL